MTAFVVCRDGDVDEFGGGVGIAERDDRDVDVRGLLDSLGVGARVRDDDEARLFERAGDVVGEVTGREAASDGDGAGVRGEFEDSTLSVGTSGDDGYVGRVVDCCDDASCQDDFLPVAANQLRQTDGLTASLMITRSCQC